MLNEYDFKKNLKSIIIVEFKNTLFSKREDLLQGENYRIVRNSIKINLYKAMKAQSFREQLNSFIDNSLKSLEDSNQTIESIVPPAVINGLKVYIYNHKDELVETLKKFLSSDDIDQKIQQEIKNVLGGISPMASRFVNPNNLFTKFKSGINDYLDNSKNIMEIITMINNQLDGFTKKKLSDFTAYFPTESKNTLVNSISKGVIDKILSEEFLDAAIDKVEEVLFNALESIEGNEENSFSRFDEILSSFLDSFYDKLLDNNKTRELIELLSSSIVDNLLNKPLISFIEA